MGQRIRNRRRLVSSVVDKAKRNALKLGGVTKSSGNQERRYTNGGYLVRDNGVDMFNDWMKGR